ncbi:MAG: HepT-like ribonuclease domain-containing protein [Bacteroidota bacterium]
MTRKAKKYLFDILTAIQNIQDFHLSGIDSLQDFEEDVTAMRAVERELEIIGEAAYRLRKLDIHLTQADELINRRNTIIHQYDGFHPKAIWYFVAKKLQRLKEETSQVLNS